MSKAWVCLVALALAAPVVSAQQDPTNQSLLRQQELRARAAQNNAKATEQGNRQAWLDSMANLTKLRTKLAQAWQGMGMSPQGAKVVADAYDPIRATGHRESVRGKSEQEIATMLKSALIAKRYMAADQILIDYQRQKLSLDEMPPAQRNP